MTCFQIFYTFFKIGAFTIGGGYAMLPLVQNEVCSVKGWLTDEEFLDSLSLTNSLPGALIINCASFIGYRLKKVKGVLSAVAGCILPSLIIITLIALIFSAVIDNRYVAAFFKGVRPAIVAIMISAIIKLAKSANLKSAVNIAVMLVAFVLMAFFKVSSIWMVLAAAVLALLLSLRKGKEAGRG